MKPLPVLPKRARLRDCIQFLKDIARWIGPGFHPDTRFDDYVTTDGQRVIGPLFDDETAKRLQADFDEVYDTLVAEGLDPCEIAFPIQRRYLLAKMGR